MKRYKKMLCAVVCTVLVLLQVGCSKTENAPVQTEAPATETTSVPTEVPVTEPSQIPVESYLDEAQGFLEAGDYASAVSILEEAQSMTEDDRITAMLAQIDTLWVTDLEAELFTTGEHLKSGKVVIHSVSVQERANKATRYTVAYSAPAGMHIRLVGTGLDHYFDFKTEGQQDTVIFEIAREDVRRLNGTVGMQIGFSDEDFYYLEITIRYPVADIPAENEDEIPDEFEVSLFCEDQLRDCQGNVESLVIKNAGDFCNFTISHALPPDMDIKVYGAMDGKGELLWESASATDAERTDIQIALSKEAVSQCKRITIVFESQITGSYSVILQVPFQVQKTVGVPVGEPVPTGYAVENELKSGSYEIHDITAQRLSNGYVRFTADMTLPENVNISAFLITDTKNQSLFQFDAYNRREKYCFDIHEEQLSRSKYLYLFVRVGADDQNRLFVNIPHSCITAVTDGTASSKSMPLEIYEWENPDEEQYQFHRCTARTLDNGYIRYTLTCTLPQDNLCYFFDPPKGNDVSVYLATGSNGGKQTFVMDVKEETAKAINELTFIANFLSGRNQAAITIDNSPVVLAAGMPNISVTLIDHGEMTQPAAA